ncbi:hypothetical protein [Roseicella aquatilis]|uniref:Uncharacterized protein n=1 Tax=Roseicella aquatilis TaxID=2527868 RepID=A0A4R4DWT2_9PROT|nr:hypothetical protein [Roseicella aquatilis]TCZ65323.1 hypothetical protein EXY23_03870 [Roseicella aquatilis]
MSLRRGLGWALLIGGGLALAVGGALAALGRWEIEPLRAFLATVAVTAGLALRARDPALGSRETAPLPFPGAGQAGGGDGGNSPGGMAEGDAGDGGGGGTGGGGGE